MEPLESIYRAGLFSQRVAIVTGGATGIGLAIAESLAMLGARVVIASRNRRRLEISARGLANDHGAEVEAVVCNIRDRDAIDALLARTLERFGQVDFVVNNGGGQFPSPAEEIRPKGWHAVIETNLTGTFQMCQAAFHAGMRERGGKIVNIVADVARGYPMLAHTGAARAGVINLTKSLAVEWAQYGILVNAVAPGTILSTGMHNYPPGTVAQAMRAIPLKRLGTTQEVADSVLYFLSPAGDFCSGATLAVDGGGSLWGHTFEVADPPSMTEPSIPPWPEERWPEHAAAVPEDDE